MKRVYPIESRCIGCRLCEVACITAHSKSKDLITSFQLERLAFNNERAKGFVDPADALKVGRPRTTARCAVSPSQPYRVSTRCRHCDDASCVLACKNGALYKDEDGRVLLDEAKCAGCWMCIMACPSGSISRNVSHGNVPGVENNGINHHCDMCAELGSPSCVQVCPVGALVFEDRDDDRSASELAPDRTVLVEAD
jgi:anaerobic carbon-monoxide dehydrogenase iron sulfur subunit